MSEFIREVNAILSGKLIARYDPLKVTREFIDHPEMPRLSEVRIGVSWYRILHLYLIQGEQGETMRSANQVVIEELRHVVYGDFIDLILKLRRQLLSHQFQKANETCDEILAEIRD